MSLFSALRASADAMSVFEKQLTISSNNVGNASTPGYVRQSLSLQALPVDPVGGLAGGVAAGPVQDARDIYAEQSVQRAVTSLGTWEQQAATLSQLEGGFDITGQSGIPSALNKLYQSFASWATTPGDNTVRQSVLDSAQSVADAFHQQSTALSQASQDADSQLRNLVDQVNTLAKQLRQDNVERSGTQSNAALEANVYSTLEQLSELVPITTLKEPDGSMTVLLAGQTPLVVGENQYDISAKIAVPDTPPPANPSGPPSAGVIDSSGNDVTAIIKQGKIGGLLYARNTVLAGIVGDSSQPGSLNRLAQAVADRVNGLLTSGYSDAGPPPTWGVPIFSYDLTNPANVAQTLTFDSTVQPNQLAAIDPGPPSVSNGTALALANLASPQNAADELDGVSYLQFYGQLAGNFGNAVATAQNNQTVQQGLVTQARSLRQDTSGVSLDAEAISVLQFQRAYQAASKMVSVLDQLTELIMNMLH